MCSPYKATTAYINASHFGFPGLGTWLYPVGLSRIGIVGCVLSKIQCLALVENNFANVFFIDFRSNVGRWIQHLFSSVCLPNSDLANHPIFFQNLTAAKEASGGCFLYYV